MTATLIHPDELVDLWRDGVEVEGADNPAGPVYTAGRWAESDLAMTWPPNTRCSSCTASTGGQCC